jgi:ribosome-associated translation inhibitor RaiA
MTKRTARPRASSVPVFEIGGLRITKSLRTRVAQRLRRALAGVRTSPVHVRITFSDVNGPKGGVDVRCAIGIRIPQTAAMHAEATSERDVIAFDRSAALISRQIRQRLALRQESSRRPKKYFAARRLL